jgi:hypothetical protein
MNDGVLIVNPVICTTQQCVPYRPYIEAVEVERRAVLSDNQLFDAIFAASPTERSYIVSTLRTRIYNARIPTLNAYAALYGMYGASLAFRLSRLSSRVIDRYSRAIALAKSLE